MLTTLSRNWGFLALRGLAAIIFGILALVWPSVTVLASVLLFGAFAFVDGVFSVTTAITSRKQNDYWWPLLFAGVAGILFGLLTWFWPGATALVLVYLIAAWALVTGIFHIVAAIQLRKVMPGEWMLLLSGIAYTIFGIFLMLFPGDGAVGLVWAIGIYAIMVGTWLMIFAFRLKNLEPTHNVTLSSQKLA